MANYQSTHTGAEIDAGIDLLDKNSATQGQVLTANGTGGASWQNASGGGIPIGGGHTVNYRTDALNSETIIVFGGNVIYSDTSYETNEEYFGLHNSVGNTSGLGSGATCSNVVFIIVKSSHVADITLNRQFYDTALGSTISSITSNNLRHILVPITDITMSDTD